MDYSLSFEDWGKEVTLIRNDETQARSPLYLSESQQLMDRVVRRLRSFRVPVRIDVLKSRQTYASTYFAHLSNRDAALSPEPVRHAIASYKWKSTRAIMDMLDLAQKNYPPEWHWRVKYIQTPPTIKYLTTGARIESMSGEDDEPARGENIQFLHCSEVAYYWRPKEFMRALLQSVPHQEYTTVVRETTARGYDSYFYPQWRDDIDQVVDYCKRYGARDQWDLIFNLTGWGDKKGYPRGVWPGGYFPIFIPWKMMRKYRIDPASIGLTEDMLTKAERAIMENHELDLPQMAWRRHKIREAGGSRIYYDEDEAIFDFNQEYPLTQEEAFKSLRRTVIKKSTISIGRSVAEKFARTRIEVKGHVRPLIENASLRWDKEFQPRYNAHHDCINKEKIKARAYRDPGGDLLIFKAPQRYPGHHTSTWWHRYVIGCDIAEGLEQGDYSVAAVLDRVRMQFVAVYRGHPNGLQFAEIMAQLGKYYDDAWINGEINFDASVLLRLQEIYSNICPRPDVEKGRKQRDTEALWVRTLPHTKKHYVELLTEFIEAKPLMMPFVQFWEEAQSFTRDERGRMGAEGKRKDPAVKNYDDFMIAAALAIWGHHYAPRPYQGRMPETDSDRERRKWEKRLASQEAHGAASSVPRGLKPSRVV